MTSGTIIGANPPIQGTATDEIIGHLIVRRIIAMTSEQLRAKRFRLSIASAGARTAWASEYYALVQTGLRLYSHFSRKHLYVFRLSEQQLKRLLPVHHPECDFQFSGLLDFEEGVSKDDGAWTRPPKVLSVEDAGSSA
jgi:hypothetical protein